MSEFQIFISEPHIVIPRLSYRKPLGVILQESELILPTQVEIALQDQKIYSDLKLGEILALRGWLKQETADFFAQEWEKLLAAKEKQQIGYYLRRAALLDEKKIQEILAEQKKLGVRFGSVAVLRGWLKDKTLEFFLRHLYPEEYGKTAWHSRDDLLKTTQMKKQENLEPTKLINLSELPQANISTKQTSTSKQTKTHNNKSSLEILLDSIDTQGGGVGNLYQGAKDEDDDLIKWIG